MSEIEEQLEGFPQLGRDTLVGFAGWGVYKSALAMVRLKKASIESWEKPILKGTISGGAPFRPTLTLRSLTFLQNRCSCAEGRRGLVCAHAVALCIEAERIRDEGADQLIEESAASKVAQPVAQAPLKINSLVHSAERGLQFSMRLILPPQMKVKAASSFILKLEVEVQGERMMPEKIDRGMAYDIPEWMQKVGGLVESWCKGRLHGFLDLPNNRIIQLLELFAGQPHVYWANDLDTPLNWQSADMVSLYTRLKNGAIAKKTTRKPSPPKSLSSSSVSTPASPARQVSIGKTYVEIDGSSHFLSVKIAKEKSHVGDAMRALLRSEDFRLEPSNGRWWQRDRHKALTFMAKHLDRLRGEYGIALTDNFQARTANVQVCKTKISTYKKGDDWIVETDLDAGKVDVRDIHRAIASGQSFLEQGGEVYLFPEGLLDELGKVQQRISQQKNRVVSPSFSQRIRSHDLVSTMEMLEGLVDPGLLPAEWIKKKQYFDHATSLPKIPLSSADYRRLRPYQQFGVNWLWFLYKEKLGGILADEMGLGKTLQAISLIQAAAVQKSTKSPFLVVCPAALLENWVRELQKFAPDLRAVKYHGANRQSLLDRLPEVQVVVTSYGIISQDVDQLCSLKWQAIVIDEAQAIKNAKTLNAVSLRRFRAPVRFALTGTPIENSWNDLASISSFLFPGWLAAPDKKLPAEDRAWMREEHMKKVSSYVLRRTKSEVAKDLPERIDQVVFCDLEDKQRKIYQQWVQKTQNDIAEMQRQNVSENRIRFAAFSKLLRLRQVCSDPRVLDDGVKMRDSVKAKFVQNLLVEAQAEGKKVLLFSQFTKVLHHHMEDTQAAGHSFLYLDGQTKNRVELCDEFNQSQTHRAFFVSLKAGGVGLNITGADIVVLLDPWWNPAVEAQAMARAHRIGRTEPVTCIKLVASGTVEERVLEMQKDKEALLESLFEESAQSQSKWDLSDWAELLGAGTEA